MRNRARFCASWESQRSWERIPRGRSSRIPPSMGGKRLRDVGWDGQHAGAGGVPDQSLRVAGEGFGGKVRVAWIDRAHIRRAITGRSYFHNSGPEADRAYEHYLTAIANAVDAFRKQRNVFVIMVATERLDARPAKRISEKLGGVPVLTLRGLQHV